MQIASLPPNESQRLEALRQTGVLDTRAEESFDRLTNLAAKICGAPIAVITLVDADRQWFKSRVGLDATETPRDVAFCAHAILQTELLIVPDALKDERFADNPLVVSDPKIRFYAGSPLITHDGNAVGTFCIIDSVPRELDVAQIEALKTLAHHATTLLELRRIKELLRAHALEWERAGENGDTGACAQALERLGQDLKEMVEARELSEISFRDLERDLQKIAPTPTTEGAVLEIDHLLREITQSSERLLHEVHSNESLRQETLRIAACARQAREELRDVAEA